MMSRCGGATPFEDEARQLQQHTCSGRPPTSASDIVRQPWRVTATWTCEVLGSWSEYVPTLDKMPGYQRRTLSATQAVYGRSTDTDYYLLTFSLRTDVAGQVQVTFTAGPF
jgi:hypothetical protein